MSPQRFFVLSLGIGALLLATHYAFTDHLPTLARLLDAPARLHVPDWTATR